MCLKIEKSIPFERYPVPIFMEEKHIHLFKEYLSGFASITEGSFTELISISQARSVSKGEYLVHAGQVARKLYFVCEGTLVSIYLKNGASHIKNFFIEGNLAGSTVSMLISSPSAFIIQALENGVVLELDFRRYRQLISEREDLKNFYIGYLEQSWVIKNEKRQIAFATENATERYLTFLEMYPTLEERISQLHIASYLGITPTQLSRIRKKL